MSLNFSHSFPFSFKAEDDFITKIIGNVEWVMKLFLKYNVGVVVISSKPIGEKTCPLVPWTVTFDVCVSKTVPGFGEQNTIHTIIEQKINAVTSAEFANVEMETFSVQPNVKSLKVEISNIRTKGIHKFGMKNLDSADAKEDLVLDVDGEKLHCHSQILSWNSKIFKNMIEEGEVPSEICLKDMIPLLELRELLHYLYLPCEPVDDHNFRKLLHWGHKFEVNHIVQLCHQYMESLLLSPSITETIQLEILLLSWRYSIENLKNMYTKKQVPLKSSGWMMKLVETEVYQDMDQDLKLQMWEYVIKIFKY